MTETPRAACKGGLRRLSHNRRSRFESCPRDQEVLVEKLLSAGGSLEFAFDLAVNSSPTSDGCRDQSGAACQWCWRGSPSLVGFVVGVMLERWDLPGEQTPVLGIPVDRFE